MSLGVDLLLLPGLDGTSRLFERFVRAAPAEFSVSSVALPPDRVLSYDELVEFAGPSLAVERLVLLGESFSGPLALRLAAHARPLAVILCASFLRAPMPGRLLAKPLSFLLRSRPPLSLVKAFLCGGDEALAEDLVRAVATVDSRVIASRVRMVLGVDATPELVACPSRLLYLRPTQDRVVDSRRAELVRRLRPDAEVGEIVGPHLLLQARPAECWAGITSFLAPLSSR